MSFSGRRSNAVSSRVVFLANIPWEKTEADLYDILSSVGPMAALRLQYDRETGRSKGFGWAAFEDVETASSAARNLDGYDLGGRFLRVEVVPEEQMPSSSASGSDYVLPSAVLFIKKLTHKMQLFTTFLLLSFFTGRKGRCRCHRLCIRLLQLSLPSTPSIASCL